VNYKDIEYLKEECQDGRQLGFTGKVLHFLPTRCGNGSHSSFNSKPYIRLKQRLSTQPLSLLIEVTD
jgi:hypothetical protein